jgi:hypothetical protein
MAGTMLTGTNGWYGVSNAVQVVEEDPGFNLGYPLSGDHTRVLELTDSVSNLFVVGETDGSGGAPGGVQNPPWVTKETFIDMMVKPVPRDSAPANLDTNVQVAVYLDTDGHLNIYHRYMENYDLEPDQGQMEGVWSTLTNGPAIPTGTWFRLTITIGYVRDPWSGSYPDANNQYDTYYSVQVNGGERIIGQYGNSKPYTVDDTEGWYEQVGGGPWFLVANQGADGNAYYSRYWLTSISTEGPGKIDDLVVVTDSNALASATTPYGIPQGVYDTAGITDPDGDDDGDGIPNWKELVAGTNPGEVGSYFQVTGVKKMGTSTVVDFNASNDYGLNAQVTMLRTTMDLATVTPGDWQPVGPALPAGSTQFVDANPPDGKAYYKPVIYWVYGQ